ARPDQAATVTIAAQRHEQIETLAPHASQISGGRLVRDVACNRPQVADVIGEALELESDPANCLCARRLAGPRQSFDHAAVSAAVTDDAVAGDGLGNQHRAI